MSWWEEIPCFMRCPSSAGFHWADLLPWHYLGSVFPNFVVAGRMHCLGKAAMLAVLFQTLHLSLLPREAGSPMKGVLIWESGRSKEHLSLECVSSQGQVRMLREKIGNKGWV